MSKNIICGKKIIGTNHEQTFNIVKKTLSDMGSGMWHSMEKENLSTMIFSISMISKYSTSVYNPKTDIVCKKEDGIRYFKTGFNDDSFFYNVCPDFNSIKRIIDSDVATKKEDKYRIFKGAMQSKKTWAIMSTALYYLFRYKISSFIVVQNSIDACTQMTNRIIDLLGDYCEFMNESGITNLDHVVKVIDCSRGKMASKTELKLAVNGTIPRIYVVLRSVKDIRPVNEKLVDGGKYVVIIDESDFNDSGTTSKVQDHLDVLKDRAMYVYDVTATPMTSLMKERVKMDSVLFLTEPQGYKGIETIFIEELSDSKPCVKKMDNPFERDKNLESFLLYFSNRKPKKCDNKMWHPMIALVRIGSVVDPQFTLARYIERHLKKITCITYNGTGITIRGQISEDPITIDGNESVVYNGVHKLPQGIHIGSVIAYLQKQGAKANPRIIIIAGKLADRGISFCNSDYKKCIDEYQYPWHITDMYYLASKTTTQSNLLQAVGRLCGVFFDNVPRRLYTNAKIDILKSYGFQEEIIERATEKSDEFSVEIIPNLPISRCKMAVGRKATCVFLKIKFTLVNDDKMFGGFDWESRGLIIDESETVEEYGNVILVPEPKSTQNYNQLWFTAASVLFNLGAGKWHRRAIVVNEMQEELDMGTKAIQARLKDFYKKRKFHKAGTEESRNGILFRKEGREIEMRVNK